MKMTDPESFTVPSVKERVCFNGKFLSAEGSGVHRVAAELVRALDQLLVERRAAEPPIEILMPRNAVPGARTRRILPRVVGALTWIPWEQLDLPRHARGGLLVNLCNLGPLATRRAITMVHDAQVYLSPRSYSLGFRLWYRLALPVLGRRNQRILTVSSYSRDQIARFGIAPKDRITVIRNGADHILRPIADTGALARLGLTPRRYACALASTQAHKNIGVPLAAFARPELADLGETDRHTVRPMPDLPFKGYGKLSGRLIDGQSGTVMQPSTQPPLSIVIFADERRAMELPAVCTSTP